MFHYYVFLFVAHWSSLPAHLTIFFTSFLINFLRGRKRKPLPVPSLQIHFFCLKCESSVFFINFNRILFLSKVAKLLFLLFFLLFFKVLGS